MPNIYTKVNFSKGLLFSYPIVPCVILVLIVLMLTSNWAVGQKNDNVLFAEAHGNITYKPGDCPPNKNLLKGSFKISIKYTHAIGDTLFYKLYFDELYGQMGDAAMTVTHSSELYSIMKVIDDEVHLQSMVGNIDGSIPVFNSVHFFDFDAKAGKKWGIQGGMLDHNNVVVTCMGQMKLDDDTLYDFAVDGDRATSHTLYMNRFLISKRNGFAAFVCDTGSPGVFGCYFSAKYRKYRRKICEYLSKRLK